MDKNKFLVAWYTLKTSVNNEDYIAKTIRENTHSYNLQEIILEVQNIKDVRIEEKSYPQNSEELPKKVFRNTKKSQWVRLRDGSYKKIRIIEDKPFKGLIFVKLKLTDKNRKIITDLIRSWFTGINFLSETGTQPASLSDEEFLNMAKPFLNQPHPDLQQYLIDHNLINQVIHESVNKKVKPIEFNPLESDWSDFDIVSKSESEKLFTNENEEFEDGAYVSANGIIDVVMPNSEPSTSQGSTSPTKSEPTVTAETEIASATETIEETTVSEPSASEPQPEPVVEVSAVVEEKVKVVHPTITWEIGDQVWIKSYQVHGEIKAINQDDYKLTIEIELFSRLTQVEVSADDVEELNQ